MGTETHRITIVIPEDLEAELRNVKKEVFFDCNRSVMLRELISKGIESSIKSEKCNDLSNV